MKEKAYLNTGSRCVCRRKGRKINSFCDLFEFVLGKRAHFTRTIYYAPKQHREKHEMIILDPDHGARTNLLTDYLRKLHIRLAIRLPILLVEIHLSGVVMEQRP